MDPSWREPWDDSDRTRHLDVLHRSPPAPATGPDGSVNGRAAHLPAWRFGAAGQTERRVALYSHDAQGLGHVRRNSLIAGALVHADPDVRVLLLTGSPEAPSLPLPPRTSVVTVPALAKSATGSYRPRSLPLPLADVIAMRAEILRSALVDFEPHLLIVDKCPLGVQRELASALYEVRARFGTRTVLGLRDVLDAPAAAIREWEADRATAVVSRSYDQVWVYGDPAIYDPAHEYRWPRLVRDKVVYTGYLGRGRTRVLPAEGPGAGEGHAIPRPFVLGLVGGGQDGAALSRAFMAARLPPGHHGVLVTGPYLNETIRRELVAACVARDDVTVLGFVHDVPDVVDRATASVAMGGYNTVCELLASGQPTLLVPRTTPRREQAVRAARLENAGLVDVLTPQTLTPDHLSRWFASAVTRPRRRHVDVDLDGLSRIPGMMRALVPPTRPEERARAAV